MGCTSSKPANPAADFAKELDRLGPLPELEWYYRPIWSQYVDYIYDHAQCNGTTQQLRKEFSETMNNTAKEFLQYEYPECDKAGTTEDMGEDMLPFGSDSSPCVQTKSYLTLDEGFNGIVYATTLVVHSPMAWKSVSDGANSALPGSIMDDPKTKLAQRYLTFMVYSLKQRDTNVKHCVLNIIIGSVMMTARWEPHNLIPSLAMISQNTGSEIPKPESLPEATETSETNSQLPFRSCMFMSILRTLETNYPGCAIWDAGEMSFEVEDKPYPLPARLLICRDFEKRTKDVATIDFKVTGQDGKTIGSGSRLIRARDPTEDPGGIVCLAFVVNVDPEDPWPKRDLEKHRLIMGGAFAEASLHGMVMAFTGGFDRCALRVWAGQDTRHATLITPHTKGSAPEHVQQFSELLFGKMLEPLKTAANLEDASDLTDTFGVETERQVEHTLWQSESHFQHIRHQMRERAKANPEAYEMIHKMAGHSHVPHFMERNFKGCLITDEGELPQPDLKGEPKFESAKIFVARDPKQEPSSIVAAIVSVPSPVPGYNPFLENGKSWLDTPELKRAEDALLAVLKQWYSEGKISAIDCHAQVTMGIDASIYQFIDGVKFVDYPDERMKELVWQ
ncbi:hypothetical protein NLG97_g4722 [Lecanicillium saksenae]|uniref:Uncharacterized protein n=1 Tax=Lecanicillium saksenae TaxID=468837 RepID=A0ACC1QXM3_9HYPO|nr:hypothetical protein NLG97_g4722 [Lecanicillium saksenae]